MKMVLKAADILIQFSKSVVRAVFVQKEKKKLKNVRKFFGMALFGNKRG